MRKTLLGFGFGTVLTLACQTSLAATTDNALSSEEKSQGWELLFDGHSLDKWRNYKGQTVSPKWVIDDGAMHLSTKGGGDVISRDTYDNFDLKLEWKVSKAGNSGIFILADEKGGAVYSHAPEIQILDNERHSDNKIDSHLSGSLYDMVASPARSHKPAGEWNQVRIQLLDKHLQVWQNGIQTTSIVIGSTTWNKLVDASKFATWKGFGENHSGYIGLQDHGDPVWFRNIKIRSL
ncbi:DUF1080 domain-containing protein [Aestuariibacter sp. AA17]|uniref:DUF1080 domain-containing protein n=1 Tax=Fluctibacter corallii TaxID=2984329 RepID=A0ABT3A9Z6_9ALTE|nr:DUF1080 domain-containing protein [Aestuariibacter sp. AA17]MCV2885513.1 DUF1080 domain-containing protein [Aestuariibacter sp. AA17]